MAYINRQMRLSLFFFFNDTATTEIYTLSLHDALPICNFHRAETSDPTRPQQSNTDQQMSFRNRWSSSRSEEHTSELQSHLNLVCRLLLEKKNNKFKPTYQAVLRRSAVQPLLDATLLNA